MKRRIALLMVAMILLPMCACGTEYTETAVYGTWVWDSSKDAESTSLPYQAAAVAFGEDGTCAKTEVDLSGNSTTYAGKWTLEKNVVNVSWTNLLEGENPSYEDPSEGGRYKYDPTGQKFEIVDTGILKSGVMTWIFDATP